VEWEQALPAAVVRVARLLQPVQEAAPPVLWFPLWSDRIQQSREPRQVCSLYLLAPKPSPIPARAISVSP
jgi:hypothetical protein